VAYGKEVRDAVRRAYVFNQLTLELAAAQQGVPFVTARRWKTDAKTAGDDWDKLRAAYTLAGGGLEDVARSVITALIVQTEATLEQIKTSTTAPDEQVKMLSSLGDAFHKLVAANAKMMPQTSQLATAIDVIRLLQQFIKERYPQHLQAFDDVLEPFGSELEKRYG
jgi:hypothetical protein